MRPRHPKKEIEKAIQYAEQWGWYYKASGRASHGWGRVRCPDGSKNRCKDFWIWSTPKSPDMHAKRLRYQVNHYPHRREK